ncbi:MAG: hypothetical protein Q7T20_08000, partial [Saprospiraceae bacterium]|nr:hypothetical protein [Saprospiraceae bacterium]
MLYQFSKTLSFVLLLLCSATSTYAQIEKARQLEAQLRGVSAAKRVEILLALADANLYAGEYAKAIDNADDAGKLASKLKLPELRANALNRKGKGMMLSGKRKAAGQFEQSLKILRDNQSANKVLALDNLENLRTLAKRDEKERELKSLEEQIARLRGGGTISGQTDTRQELQKEFSNSQQQLLENQRNSRKNESKLIEESQALQAQLAAQKAELDKMTEEQMKTAMVVMQQRVLLDSVHFSRGMDSLAVSNANLALSEAESNRKFNYAVMGVLLLLAAGAT